MRGERGASAEIAGAKREGEAACGGTLIRKPKPFTAQQLLSVVSRFA
jgi:hypothetical protein